MVPVSVPTLYNIYQRLSARKSVLTRWYQYQHHPCIAHTDASPCGRLYEVVESPRHVHLVMEYAPSGDLERRSSREGPLTEATARTVFSQLLSAVQHMVSVQGCLD